ncbi:capsular polysaccharide synthesis protein [Cereibacter sphaeroides]|uniref:capsular polysaccharide synthesis protein n=1 Tax=Cereibacter sphaeroides TaxID=1063 RepID=UPI001F4254C9|nr:capsular polysaccharide synthesis protein [Cereibacter sphaeroides]
MYWHSGVDNAPPLARLCIESWQRRNLGWTVRVLDDVTLAEWVDMHDVLDRNPRITIQAFADVLRWRLLARHGGVWADATLYCNRPLDDWLPEELEKSPIFVFRSNETFLLHSWFIAALDNSQLVPAMVDQMTDFTCRFGGFRHYFELRGLWRIYHLIETRAGRGNYFIWRSWPFRRFLKASPYFFQNYLLGYLVSTLSECQREFGAIAMTYGESPHALQDMTQDGRPPAPEAVQRLLAGDCPVQKLTLKRHVREWTEGGILDLLDRHGRNA